MAEVGDIARIDGLKSQPALNGCLCKVLRKAEAKEGEAERLVVRSSQKEYALKPANLETGDAVFPGGAKATAAAVLGAALLAVLEVAGKGGRRSLGIAAVPVAAGVGLLGTLALCFRLHWPGRAEGEWFPAVSELSAVHPSRGAYRSGFFVVGLLAAITCWLNNALVMKSLVEYTPPPPQANVTDVTNGTNATNATRSTRYEGVLQWGPESSVHWGYAAAGGLACQGMVNFDSRLSVRSGVHLVGMGVFIYAAWSQCVLSTMVLSSPRGAALVAAAPRLLPTVLRLRQRGIDYGPLVLLAIPLGSQYLSFSNRNKRSTEPPSMRSALKDSGTTKLVGFIEWAAVVSYAILLSSYGAELFVASWL